MRHCTARCVRWAALCVCHFERHAGCTCQVLGGACVAVHSQSVYAVNSLKANDAGIRRFESSYGGVGYVEITGTNESINRKTVPNRSTRLVLNGGIRSMHL